MNGAPRRILAVDFGDARTGLAATDWTGTIVVPLDRIDARDEAQVAAAIAALVAEREAEIVVVGVPLSVEGGENPRATRTRAFAARLRTAIAVPVVEVDESHSTDEAHERLKQGGLKASQRKRLADSVAAMVILERYRATLREGDVVQDVSAPVTVTTAEPQPAVDSVTLVGSLQSEIGCPADWQPDCAASHLTFDSTDGRWHGTFTLDAGDYEWKVAIDDSWDVNYGAGGASGGGNLALSVPADGTAYVFTWDQVTHVPSVAPAG